MAFFFSREGPVEEFGAAEELAETPEAMEMSAVLWHEARCRSEQLKALAEELRTLEEQEQHEELVVRALMILAVRALLRNLACMQAS